MNKFNLLECTLRDGGYITGWNFGGQTIRDIIAGLSESNYDFIEVGYLNNKPYKEGSTQFNNIEQITEYLPTERKNAIYLAMADVQQFLPENITPYSGKSIEGIRVVFYKHQIEEAITLGKAVIKNGYKLFMQPMVTIDYSMDEFVMLAKEINELNPFAVSIVDSFGYMIKSDFRQYYRILDNLLSENIIIGFHSHNNMNLALINAQDILEYQTERKIIIDSTMYGMGRGAGNLHTELISNYYNITLGEKYDLNKVMGMIGKFILPIFERSKWGYSPYYLITALYHCHPNYVAYLLQERLVTVSEFMEFVKMIPREMYTKCQKTYVLQLYDRFKKKYHD